MKIGKSKYEKTQTTEIHDAGVDIQSREIWLVPNDQYVIGVENPIYGDIGVEFSMANRFLKNLHILMNASDEPILIHMSTHGGDWHHGMAIYDAIKTCPCYITIVNYTHARSMSSIIFCAADRRVMMPHSVFMFHDGSIGADGTVKQFLTEAKQAEKACKQMRAIYVDRMLESDLWKGKKRTQCDRWLKDQMDKKEDVYLDPIEAISQGFADMIFDGNWDYLADKP